MADEPAHIEIVERALGGQPAGVLTRLDYGSITLPSGRLIVADPGLHDSGTPAPVSLPPGTYPVVVLINDPWWAYAAIVLSDATPVRWQRLGSVPVDCGAACFMSAEASERFLAWRPPGDLMKELWEPFHAATRPTVKDQVRPPTKPFHLRVGDDRSHAIPIFHAGGDGRYPFFLGLDGTGAPCRVLLDFHVGVRDIDDDEDDTDDEPALPRLPPEDAAFLKLGVDEVGEAPESDTPAMARARERHQAGLALQNDVLNRDIRGAMVSYLEAVSALRGTTVPYPELLLDIAVCYGRFDDAHRPFAEAAAVRFERRARGTKGRGETLFQMARACALAGNKPAMIQALKQSIALHAGNAARVRIEDLFNPYRDDRDLVALLALARRGRR